MHPWERRLKDLAHLLSNCETAYFEPELFRMNTNQFLQTARTVTFIIQKSKSDIPNYEDWYSRNVLQRFSEDELMTWAKDSRNRIEKVGDLELYSHLDVTLIISYLQEDDLSLRLNHDKWISASVKRLVRLARRKLPSGVADVGVIKIERRWVANTLPEWELMTALTYIYARLWTTCVALAMHLGNTLNKEIPEPSDFDPAHTDARQIRYVHLKDSESGFFGRQQITRIEQDPNFTPPPSLKAVLDNRVARQVPQSLESVVEFYGQIAKSNFETYGNHIPMLTIFDDDWKVIDFLATQFQDQATKFIFWRAVADRVLVLKPHALIWVSEAWIRDIDKTGYKAIRHLAIRGEQLAIVGMDKTARKVATTWSIRRDGAEPRLEEVTDKDELNLGTIYYLAPVEAAFRTISFGG